VEDNSGWTVRTKLGRKASEVDHHSRANCSGPSRIVDYNLQHTIFTVQPHLSMATREVVQAVDGSRESGWDHLDSSGEARVWSPERA